MHARCDCECALAYTSGLFWEAEPLELEAFLVSYNEGQMPCGATLLPPHRVRGFQRRSDVMQDNHSDEGVNIEPSRNGH